MYSAKELAVRDAIELERGSNKDPEAIHSCLVDGSMILREGLPELT